MQGYRTYIAAAIVALGGIIAQTNWIDMFANPKAGMVAFGSAVLMAVMRSITATPPGTSA